MLDLKLKNILAQSKIEFEQSGKAQQLRDQKWSEDMIKGAAELQQLRAFDAWLKTPEGQQFLLDGGIQRFNLKTAENETRAKLIAAARTSGIDLSSVLGPEFYNRSGGPGNVPTSRTAVGSAPLDVLSGGQAVRPSIVDERRTPAPSRPPSRPIGRTGGVAPAGSPAPATQTPHFLWSSPSTDAPPAKVSPALSPAPRQQVIPSWRTPALKEAGAVGERGELYRKARELRQQKASLEDRIGNVQRNQASDPARFRIVEIQRLQRLLAGVNAQLQGLVSANPWLKVN